MGVGTFASSPDKSRIVTLGWWWRESEGKTNTVLTTSSQRPDGSVPEKGAEELATDAVDLRLGQAP